jgi:hypothetical protein
LNQFSLAYEWGLLGGLWAKFTEMEFWDSVYDSYDDAIYWLKFRGLFNNLIADRIDSVAN